MKEMLSLYMTDCERYDSRQICRCSSMVERSFRKAEVVGPTPTIGCGFCYEDKILEFGDKPWPNTPI